MVSFSDIHGGEVAHGLLSVCRLSALLSRSHFYCRQKKKEKGLKGAFAKAQEDRIYNWQQLSSCSVKFFLGGRLLTKIRVHKQKTWKIEYGDLRKE